MILTDAELLTSIEDFLGRTNMAPSRFGREAMREGQLIDTLRKGRSLSLANVNRVLGFMENYEAHQSAPEPEAAVIAERVIICAVCDEPSPDPSVRACGNLDCPHVPIIQSRAA
jgi:hypothetical protein